MEHPENSEEYKGLTVNKGIEQPSIVNPYLKLRKKPRRREFSVGEYVEGIVKGDVTVLIAVPCIVLLHYIVYRKGSFRKKVSTPKR